ncbi:hypothetical protein DFQ27_007020 [Actinomortierella ambigua]|uniref:Attractin/MKLN-like beta-propeller domain-containing protein n=1 Tax=Actinomortierella ambigua TaxID=1343610 RepID=A0A9P6U0M3_9FUNG|nr:hypothetical protein DFQ27_007020 [Actinomortierella ambigua]
MKGRYFSLLLISLTAANLTASQQNHVAPQPVAGPAYAKYKNKFYINGGATSLTASVLGSSGQFFALDLSKSWTSVSPAWIQLPDGPRKDYHGAAMSLDGKFLLTSCSVASVSHRFSFDTNTWSVSKAPCRSAAYGVSPVTLGTDGTALTAGGRGVVGVAELYEIYSFATDQAVTVPLPDTAVNGTPILPGRQYYQVVWSEPLKSAVFFGGFGLHGSSIGTVTLYHPESKQWSLMKTTGANNTNNFGHCMAITDDGKTILSFGGYFAEQTGAIIFSSSLYILNLTTGVWTLAVDSSSQRADSACTIAGDYFLLWGGSYKLQAGINTTLDFDKPSSPVFIYQISLNAWVQEYKPSAEYLNPGAGTPSASATSSVRPSSPSSSSSSSQGPTDNSTNGGTSGVTINIGAVAGGVAGAAIVVATIGFLAWRRKRQGTKHSHRNDSPSEIDQRGSTTDKGHDRQEHDARRMPPTPTQAVTYHSPQYGYDPTYDADGAIADDGRNGKDGDMYTSMHSVSSSTTLQYPPWGASLKDKYTAHGPQYHDQTVIATSGTSTVSGAYSRPNSPHPPILPASSYDYVPPPPSSLPSSRPGTRRPRGPQARMQRHTVRGHSPTSNGRWAEERPGPQWQP